MLIPLVLASVVETLVRLAEPWKSVYDDSKALSIVVVFVHLASLLVGGGLALATDRATLRVAGGTPTDRERHLAELGLTHRPVVASLAVSLLSGALLFFADVETFATSVVFWGKMAFVAVLLLNGLMMLRAERALRHPDTGVVPAGDVVLWRRLRVSAVVSGVLWLVTLLAGTVLVNS